jgi:glycosyltransferase involved in cell wall biosynthesis
MESSRHQVTPFLTQIVLYGQRLEECRSYLSLREALKEVTPGVACPIAVWDNSLNASEPDFDSHFELVNWVHDPTNSGLVSAYNRGVEIAEKRELPWVLLLDQDTHLTPEFLRSAIQASRSAISDVVAIVPKIRVDGVVRSPIGNTLQYPNGQKSHNLTGESETLIYAINSGMMIRTEFVSGIGGYSPDYRLEFVDYWFCRQVYRMQRRICVLPEMIEHSIAVYDNRGFVSQLRYKSILSSQSSFVLDSGSIKTKAFYCFIILTYDFIRNLKERFGKGYSVLVALEWLVFCRRCVMMTLMASIARKS